MKNLIGLIIWISTLTLIASQDYYDDESDQLLDCNNPTNKCTCTCPDSGIKFNPELPVAIPPVPTTYLKPKVEVCSYVKDLFDGGTYLKSACFVHQNLDYKSATQKCAEYKMNLFVLNDEVVTSHILDATQEKYPTVNGAMWVNGMRQKFSAKWQTYNLDGSVYQKLDSTVKLYSNHELGNCLQVSRKYTDIYYPLPENCDIKRYFICEHFKRTQTPPKLDTTKCLYKRDLYFNNSYVKSMCVVNQELDYDQSRRKCAEYGMNLYSFDTRESYGAFFNSAEDFAKAYPSGRKWINGQRDANTNEWYTYHSNRLVQGKIYKGFEWAKENKNSGRFLGLSTLYGPYQGVGYDSGKFWFICEYKYSEILV
ncbi:unnamed protein product [Chironomus riparius]|uniref:C-type lectin domain-containing protein n=1 Tax=Chironomus riparius TaxID=315576 RepID=A0A9N9RXZ3_9DIPT|nr:unnamed protein product [Chironomus riparius]